MSRASKAAFAAWISASTSTPLHRAVEIAGASDGFAHVVSRVGVTGGAREPDAEAAIAQLRALRSRTTRPLAVGFGVAKPEHVEQLGPHADAVVVGSALVDALAGGSSGRQFLKPLLGATFIGKASD